MKPLTFYVASRFDNKSEVNVIQATLQAAGYILTYDWTLHEGTDDKNKREYGIADTAGVRQADFLVVCWPGRTGTKIEIGIALGQKIPVFILGCPEGPTKMEDNGHGVSVFWHHPLIHYCEHTYDLHRKIEAYQNL